MSLRGDKYVFTPPFNPGQDVTQSQFIKQSTDGLNSEFSFSSTCRLNKEKVSGLP